MSENTFKICAGITLFNPTLEEINNVINYSNIFEKVYIYDNSLNEYDRNDLYRDEIELVSLGSNDGIGKACRVLTEKAKQHKFDYIMLFDQDSKISQNNIIHMIDFIKSQEVDAMVFCPQIVYNDKTKIIKGGYQIINWCITSGTIIKLEDYGETVKFDDNYFIDRVDMDFCYQVTNIDKKICQINDALLYQQLGEESVKGKSTHQPFRHYYIARNRLYFNKKFKKSNYLIVLQTIRHIFIILKNEPEKIKKIKMIFKGISDFNKGKMGAM